MKYLLTFFFAALLGGNVHAMELAGVKLADQVQVADTTLQLNGAGVRTKWFFKVYVGALYLPQKQSSAEAVIADERVHRVSLHMLRELSSTKLLGAFNEAIEANHTPAELADLASQLKQMEQIFASFEGVKQGDVITLDYVPGSGTRVMVYGTLRGTIAGAAFNRAILKIWLGSEPVQQDMKKGMLGG